MNKADKFWIKLMNMGTKLGCHQMPERSFFYKGYQFPVCSRCTGVIIATIIAHIVFFKKKISNVAAFFMSGIMFMDWFIQRIGIKESTNRRRLATGLIGGFGFTCLYLNFFAYIFRKTKR